MKRLFRLTPECILVIYIFLSLGLKHPDQKWDRIINSDGKAYYAYLPAFFIYHDFDYTFVETYEEAYYPLDKSVFKEFRMNINGEIVNKTFAGLAVVWLPFFLLAHLIALITGLPADGYSLVYQYAIAFSTLFYLWAGCRVLFNLLLKFGATISTASLIIFSIALGTNIIFYAVIEPSMVHVYSFAFITFFLWSGYRFFETRKLLWLLAFTAIFSLILLIRPTNGLILILLPFISGSYRNLKSTFLFIVQKKGWLILAILIFTLIIGIQPLFYYIQTGKLWIYSYGNEKMHFLNPHFFSILFSYNRGWFVYTPLAFLSMVGFVGLYRASKTRFYSLLAFLILIIYILSSWWMWYYASKCGQRVFIDFYAVVAILLLFLFRIHPGKTWRITCSILISILILFNIFQFYQNTKWIFPVTTITKEIFWDSFFSINPKAQVYLSGEGIIAEKSLYHDMEAMQGWGNGWRNEDTFKPFPGSSENHVSCIEDEHPYSIGIELDPFPLFETHNRIVRVSAKVWSAGRRTESSLVWHLTGPGDFSSYRAFYLEPYVRKNCWTSVQCAFYLPSGMPEQQRMKLYFFHPSKSASLYIDDLQVDFISLQNLQEFQRIEGILLSCPYELNQEKSD